jgi:hypothetical protein
VSLHSRLVPERRQDSASHFHGSTRPGTLGIHENRNRRRRAQLADRLAQHPQQRLLGLRIELRGLERVPLRLPLRIVPPRASLLAQRTTDLLVVAFRLGHALGGLLASLPGRRRDVHQEARGALAVLACQLVDQGKLAIRLANLPGKSRRLLADPVPGVVG